MPTIVTYKTYAHLYDVPEPVFKQLKKLNLGRYGCMRPVLDFHEMGYVEMSNGDGLDCTCTWCMGKGAIEPTPAPVLRVDQLEMKRYINVAFIKGKAVGWTVQDLEGIFNVFVKPTWRKLGIAQKLVFLWVRQNEARVRKHRNYLRDLCHTDEVEQLMELAARELGIWETKKKKMKLVHRLPV